MNTAQATGAGNRFVAKKVGRDWAAVDTQTGKPTAARGTRQEMEGHAAWLTQENSR